MAEWEKAGTIRKLSENKPSEARASQKAISADEPSGVAHLSLLEFHHK